MRFLNPCVFYSWGHGTRRFYMVVNLTLIHYCYTIQLNAHSEEFLWVGAPSWKFNTLPGKWGYNRVTVFFLNICICFIGYTTEMVHLTFVPFLTVEATEQQSAARRRYRHWSVREYVRMINMDLKQNVVHKLNLEFGKDIKSIKKSHDLYKKLQEEKNSIEKSVSYV